MPRVKRAVSAHKKRRTVLNRAKGYYGAKSRSYRAAKNRFSIRCSTSTAIVATRSAKFVVCGSPALTLLLVSMVFLTPFS